MSKKIKKNNGVLYVVISLFTVFSIVFTGMPILMAYSVGQTINTTVNTQGGDYIYNEAGDETVLEDIKLGATPGTWVTIDELELGTSASGRLNFTKGATTTPGGLFRIYNSGSPRICNRLELEISVGSTVGGNLGTGTAFAYRVATSTSRTLFSNDSTLIASTTNATGTVDIFDTVDSNGTGIVVAGESFLWDKGVWILGAFDDATASEDGTDYSTSSNAYVGQIGKFYIPCHIR